MKTTPPVIFIALLPLLLIPFLATSTTAAAEQLYIDDMIYVPLRASPGARDRILKNERGRQILLKSGTAVDATDAEETNGFRQITTDKGHVGWVPKQHLRKTPTARQQLRQARAQIDSLQTKLMPLKADLADLRQQMQSTQSASAKEKSSLTKTINNLKKTNEKLSKDLTYIKSISKNSIALSDTNNELLKENERLKVDIDVLKAERARLQDDSDKSWFMIGAGAVGFGALLAVIAPWFKPKRKASDYW